MLVNRVLELLLCSLGQLTALVGAQPLNFEAQSAQKYPESVNACSWSNEQLSHLQMQKSASSKGTTSHIGV